MKRSYDIIIAGAGPVGLYTAKLCSEMGYRVLVMEEHERIGEPVHCSGLVSKRLERYVDLGGSGGVIENRVNSATIHSPTNQFSLKKRGTAAYVIDRGKFDRALGKMAGSPILRKTRIKGFGVKRRMVVDTTKGLFRSEVLVGCDGAASLVAKGIGSEPSERVNGVIGISRERDRSETVDIYIDKKRIRDGFFWRIPRGKTTEYGAFGRGVNFSYPEDFFGRDFSEKRGGLIPIGPAERTFSERVLLAGDAAGLVKPWSGGGIIYGMESARAAAEAMDKAFHFNDFSERSMRTYESLWRERLGRSMETGMMIRGLLKSINNFQLEILVKLMKVLPKNWMDMDFILPQ